MELPLDTIVFGRCLGVLQALPDESVDAVVTDPPYALGTKDPTVEEIIAYLQGSSLDMGGEFMNKDWEIPSVLVWKECFRVLKPGGFLLSFAGTRTQDVMSIGIRAAGFENRDVIDAEFGPPIIRWQRAQGMPKSTDLGKAIGENSKDWKGWGTALKPYWEPILMFRKPVAEKTVVEQVLKTGTGGLNIDASRVKHSSPEDFEKHKAGVDAIKAKGGSMANSWKNSSDLSGANEVTTAGRYPPNALYTHSDACKRVGSKTVAAPVINRFTDGAKPFGNGAGHEYTTTQMGDEHGEEEVAVWDCHPSCPVRHLNEQSAGASRFFANFEPFIYVAKASQSEKSEGLDEENEHPTVKPLKLMRYLVSLVTRKGGTVLDPYAGSGTTCVAAVLEGMHFVGIEKEEPSVKTAQGRVARVLQGARELEAMREAHRLVEAIPEDDEPITP